MSGGEGRPWYSRSERIREVLRAKLRRYMKSKRTLRKPYVEDLFERVMYIGPEDLVVVNWVRKSPLAAFNPGALIRGGKLLIFPRLIFGYYHYASAVGVAEIEVCSLLNREVETPLPVRVVLYPTEPWEMALGCEDPRVTLHEGLLYMLYVGVAHDPLKLWVRPVVGVSRHVALQAIAVLDGDLNVRSKDYFKIVLGDEVHVPRSWRDSAFISIGKASSTILARPTVDDVSICWRAELDMSDYTIDVDTMEPNLHNEEWEVKVGWSTNVVSISQNEYLVGWHGVSSRDGVYREGLAVVNGEGDLVAITPHYILAPRGLSEMYGDRPGVIFGDGLVLYKDLLLWVGGVSDHVIGVFSAEMDEVLEHMVWVQKR